MAVLTNADLTFIRRYIKSRPTIRDTFNAWALPKATYLAAFQAVETYVVSGFTVRPATSIKAAIEVETGATTNARAADVLTVWAAWRLAKEEGRV